MAETISLNGVWKFRLDPKRLGEKYPDQLNYTHADDARWMGFDYDDSDWDEIRVPACWQTEWYDYNGAAWYRTSFAGPNLEASQQVWLEFDGVDYYADVWLNGHYLGSHEGYFGGFGFEITPHLRNRNVLAVQVEAPVDAPGEEHELGQLKTTLKGALTRWDMNNPDVSPGGIWNDVRLVVSGAVRIVSLRINASPLALPPPGQPDVPVEALVAVECDLHSSASMPLPGCLLRVAIAANSDQAEIISESQSIDVMPGRQTVSISLRLPVARLWWTWDLGEPFLYTATVSVEGGACEYDRHRCTFGIRRLERGEGSAIVLNGVPFFQRGANYLSDQFLSTMTRERYQRDVELLVGANLNTVHTFCVVERDIFYDLCDTAGLLVYQDFPLWLTMDDSSDLVRRAVTQLGELIAQFGHHPSVGIWNFGSQPSIANFEKLCSALVQTARELDPGRIIQQANATFAYTDEPTHSLSSFFWPLVEGERFARDYDWRWDVHLYAGWYFGEISSLREVPSEHLHLVTEFGAQALPARETLESFIAPEDRWPPRRSAYARHCMQWREMLRRVDPGDSLDDFIRRSQEYQARLVRYHVEFYRRRKFRPCAGAHLFCFNDCWPAITWSVVDYNRVPKAAYYALQKAMSPVHIMADIEDVDAHVEEPLRFTICAINDLPRPMDADLEYAIASHTEPVLRRSIRCALPAGGIIDVVTENWSATQQGEHLLTLVLREGETVLASNEYTVEAIRR